MFYFFYLLLHLNLLSLSLLSPLSLSSSPSLSLIYHRHPLPTTTFIGKKKKLLIGGDFSQFGRWSLISFKKRERKRREHKTPHNQRESISEIKF